jgi:signal transduction histidine kinase/ActR/RegA family two-component response regulator
MRLSRFIRDNMDALIADWEAFAADVSPDHVNLDRAALQDFAREMLTRVAEDIGDEQGRHEQQEKSRGERPDHAPGLTDSAQIHALQRFTRQFTQAQLLAEFRAMRASVTRRWRDAIAEPADAELNDIVRFNEAVDQLISESLATFDAHRDDERNRDERDLRQRSEQLHERDRQKDLFLATLGHELRNPLAGIDLGIRALKEGTGDRERLQELIEHEVHRLTVLTDDLLDASRIARDKVELEITEVDMNAVIEAAVQLFRGVVTDKQQTLDVTVPDAPVRLSGDAIRLRQVVENLLSNAIRYTPPEGHIHVTLAADDGGAVITVTDDGAGLAPADLEEIFEPFTQRDPDAGGLGLGLPIARRLTELHGGALSVDSPGPGQGAVFRVSLPSVAATGHRPSRDLFDRERLPRALRVVVVDDEQEFGENLALYLRVRGCQARAVTSGTELLERFEELSPHVVLMDLGLGEFSGYEAAAALGDIATGPDAPLLIAITGFSDRDSAARAEAAGFHQQLLKPLDLDRLHALLLERVEGGL